MVIASRYFGDARSADDSLIAGFGNWMFTTVINLLHGGHYTDAMGIAFAWSDPLHAANAALVVGLIGLFLLAVSARTIRSRWPVIVLTSAAVVTYIAVISVGRPVWEVAGTTYYIYPACLLLMTLLYASLDVRRWSGWRFRIAALLLMATVALHASTSRTLTREIGQVHQPLSQYMSSVASFVDAHKHEPGFTFALRPRPTTMDPLIVLREGYPDDRAARVVSRRLTQILFARYYDERAPRHVPF